MHAWSAVAVAALIAITLLSCGVHAQAEEAVDEVAVDVDATATATATPTPTTTTAASPSTEAAEPAAQQPAEAEPAAEAETADVSEEQAAEEAARDRLLQVLLEEVAAADEAAAAATRKSESLANLRRMILNMPKLPGSVRDSAIRSLNQHNNQPRRGASALPASPAAE